MFYLITIIAFVLLALKVNSLSGEVKRIKSQIDSGGLVKSQNNIKTEPVLKQEQQTLKQTIDQVQQSPQTQSNQEQPQTVESYSIDIFAWFKENWLLKLGVFLILIGFGWFVSYAFIHNWIGPVGRITLGFVVGAALALFGSIRMDKNKTQGKLFLILGSALVVITSYAARAVYDFFDPILVLGIIFMVSAYVSTIALQFNQKEMAVYGLIIAFLAPILTDARISTELLFSYLIVVSLSSIWLASIKGWSFVNALAIVGFSLFAIPNILEASLLEENFIIFSVFGIGIVYFVVSVFGSIRNDEKANTSDMIVAILDSILIITTTLVLIPDTVQSLVLAGWMIVFAVGSFITFSYTKKESFFYLYSLIAVVLLAIATAVELEGTVLIYAYAFESAIISVAGYIITRKLSIGYKLSLLLIGPMVMSLSSLTSSKWRTSGIMHDDFGILLTIGLLATGLGIFYYYSHEEAENYGDMFKEKFYLALNAIGSGYFLALVWLSSGALIENQDTAVMVSLVIYTIVGIVTYFHGLINSKKGFKYYGATLLLLVVGRLILVDVWDMQLAERVITFILIGVLFISTAFIGNKVKGEKEAVLSENINNQ